MRNLPGTVVQISAWVTLCFKTKAKFPLLLILHTRGNLRFPGGLFGKSCVEEMWSLPQVSAFSAASFTPDAQ